MEVVEASLELREQIREYASECFKGGMLRYATAVEDLDAFVEEVMTRSQATVEPDNDVLPSTTYYCLKDNEILGSIRVRRGTNARVENVIGHVGYDTKPSARGKGVATYLLGWVKDNVLTQPAIVTCSIHNPASRNVIESCGGVFLGGYHDSVEGELRRYQLGKVQN
ncbi:GNAT family N-acetyltransferase [Vibrio sp. T187]|uniref:GNAT family N-acetyltransferase n=1 Tax=Vibrio TaxID=662 RepID=UPI0010C9A5B7|nr:MULTISPECIES: GNAT family N-acetyltransferase [Vibrio]MBW3694990.1 GNAT family N-acetyltransferase [Vibrio sp. T187]